MGNCDSSSSEFSHKKDSTKFSSSPSLPLVTSLKQKKANPPHHKQKKNLSTEPNKYLLPEKIAKREDITKYYQLSKNIVSYGATSLLYIGENTKKEKFAIKRVIKSNIDKKQKMLIKEAELCLKLKHRNIINYYEIYEDNNFINIVMELGDTDLFELITKSPNCVLPEPLVIDLLLQIFEVINFLHSEARLVHSDIKPENFVIKFDKNQKNKPILKLIDFGNSLRMGIGGNPNFTNFCGTKEYMAPETLEKKGFNEKIDEWAAGVLMYNMLTGGDPFFSESDSDYRSNILFKEINFDLIKNERLRILNKKLLNRFVAKRITAKEALEEIKAIKNDMIMNNIMNNIDKNGIGNYWNLISKKLTLINLS